MSARLKMRICYVICGWHEAISGHFRDVFGYCCCGFLVFGVRFTYKGCITIAGSHHTHHTRTCTDGNETLLFSINFHTDSVIMNLQLLETWIKI